MNVRRIIHEQYAYERARNAPFVMGTDDCLRMAAGFAIRMIGRDPAEHLLGRYSDWDTYRAMLRDESWRDAGDMAHSMFPIECPVAMARAGDWAHFIQEGREGLGVVAGHLVIVRAAVGVGYLPLLKASRAFRVVML